MSLPCSAVENQQIRDHMDQKWKPSKLCLLGLSTANLCTFPHLYLNTDRFLGITTPSGSESSKSIVTYRKFLPLCIVSLLLDSILITFGNISKTFFFFFKFKLTWQCMLHSLPLSYNKVLVIIVCYLPYYRCFCRSLLYFSPSSFFYAGIIIYVALSGSHATPLIICHPILGLYRVAFM